MKLFEKEPGDKYEVYLAKLEGDRVPARDYLDTLEKVVVVKLIRLVRQFAKTGAINNDQKFKFLREHQLFEFKHTNPHARLLGYFSDKVRGVIVLTHGFTKQTNATPMSEIDRAKRIRDRYGR